jgi:hypothetical protein
MIPSTWTISGKATRNTPRPRPARRTLGAVEIQMGSTRRMTGRSRASRAHVQLQGHEHPRIVFRADENFLEPEERRKACVG